MDTNMDSLQFGDPGWPTFAFSPDPSLDADYLDFTSASRQVDASFRLPRPAFEVDTFNSITTSPVDPLMTMTHNTIDPSLAVSLVSVDQPPSVERPSSPADEETLTAYDKMTHMCVSSDDDYPTRVQHGRGLLSSYSTSCSP